MDPARPLQAVSHVIAGAVRGGLEVQAVDGVNIRVVFTVKLLPIATVDTYRPQLMHLSRHHHQLH